MKKVVHLLMLQTVIALLIIGCEKSPDSWPRNVKASLYVPQKTDDLKFYRFNGTYQVYYKTSACWPADDFIRATVTHMSSTGWQRLREDFLNSGLMHSWTREKYKQWGFYEDQKNNYVHQWIDDWEDKDNNIVRYFLTYTIKKVSNTTISSMDCNLDANVTYIPREIRPTPSDIAEMKKRADAEVEALKKQHNK